MTATQNFTLETTIERFYHWEKTTPDATFLRQPKGEHWQDISYAEAGQEARKMATALASKGLKKGDHIGILSKNCYHWILADLAIMMGGYVSVPYYASLPKEQLEDVIALSDVKLIFVGKLDSWGDKSQAIPNNVVAIKFPHYEDFAKINVGEDWNELIAQCAPLVGNPAPDLDDLWTIKFTSGTTGTPKGVMHSHRAPALQMQHEKETNWIGTFTLPELRCLSYLPLNHVGERLGLEVPCIFTGGSIAFSENLNSFAKNIQDIQPTVFFGVPRIWTKFYQGIIEQIPLEKIELLLSDPAQAEIIKQKLRFSIGMRDVKVASTGAAITPAYLKRFYSKLGIHLVEAYGMTEVCGCICNTPEPTAPQDSVGRALPRAEVKIHPDTQEILMKSPYLMRGYYNNPEKTKEVLKDGWIYSGDRGTMDEEGYVRVTGRVTDAFKTAKGSYVTPNKMEEVISKNQYVDQVCVVGLGIPQPIALINLCEEAKGLPQDQVAGSILSSIHEVNESCAKFERISTAIIISEEWSEENGLLTPTLKIKRSQIDKSYMDNYLDWEQSEENVVWC